MSQTVKFPDKLRPLFQPHRYKVAYGGRGGAKSWGFARALLIKGAERPLRILCTREIQKSIKDSVHKLLNDQIQALGLGQFYEVQATIIKGANGTEVLFAGLSDLTAESIKSFEGVDIVWCEEAQAISKRSWDILVPTIRKDGSEIWISMNPELDTDETWKRFVVSPPPGSAVIEINYPDNPWFPPVLEQERLHAKATMPKADYENIWEGKCRAAAEGAIYADEVTAMVASGRFCEVPYDPALKVHVIWDLGWNDSMSLILAQRHLSALRVIEYLEDSFKTLDWWSAELKERRYNWGKLWLPHDGAHGDYKTGKSAKQLLEALQWEVDIVPKQPVETGIRSARMALPQTYIDRNRAGRLMECLRRYRRGIPVNTGEPGAPVHDEFSHGADAFRYLATVAERLSNEDAVPKLNFATQFTDSGIGRRASIYEG
jgi:phage terminase large subunit